SRPLACPPCRSPAAAGPAGPPRPSRRRDGPRRRARRAREPQAPRRASGSCELWGSDPHGACLLAGRSAGAAGTGVTRGGRALRAQDERREAGSSYLSRIAASTFFAMSGGTTATPWAVLACSAPFFSTSATSLPSMTALQPGIRSPHRNTFAISTSVRAWLPRAGPAKPGAPGHLHAAHPEPRRPRVRPPRVTLARLLDDPHVGLGRLPARRKLLLGLGVRDR